MNMNSEFAPDAFPGDQAVRRLPGGWQVTATIVHDEDTTPSEFDCYTRDEEVAWANNQWEFVGLILRVAKNGIPLDSCGASLWGIEMNPDDPDAHTHLNEVFDDLLPVALAEGRRAIRILIQNGDWQ